MNIANHFLADNQYKKQFIVVIAIHASGMKSRALKYIILEEYPNHNNSDLQQNTALLNSIRTNEISKPEHHINDLKGYVHEIITHA